MNHTLPESVRIERNEWRRTLTLPEGGSLLLQALNLHCIPVSRRVLTWLADDIADSGVIVRCLQTFWSRYTNVQFYTYSVAGRDVSVMQLATCDIADCRRVLAYLHSAPLHSVWRIPAGL